MISQGGNERCPYKRDHQAVTETGPATEFPLLILPGVTVLTMMLIMMVIVMIMINPLIRIDEHSMDITTYLPSNNYEI